MNDCKCHPDWDGFFTGLISTAAVVLFWMWVFGVFK